MQADIETVKINVAGVEADPLRLVGLRTIVDSLPSLQLTAKPVADLAADHISNVVLVGSYSGVKFMETMAALRTVRPDLPVIVTGVGLNDDAILKALDSGAKGYVDEMASPIQLAQAIQMV